MRPRTPLLLIAATLAWSSALSAQETSKKSRVPQTLSLRGESLVAARAGMKSTELAPAVAKLLRQADKMLKQPHVAVTDKQTLLPPTNDAHDYYSLSPYWWPDPSKPDGLPYIRRDGVTNPESKRDLDQPRLAAMSDRVETLTLAWWFSGDARYADQAAGQLRTWFIDSTTRMTPHLRYAQLVRGNDKERGSGIIDGRGLIDVVDAVAVLSQSSAWPPSDDRAIRSWYADYLQWLQTSPNGKSEQAAKNNHGSWFAAQSAASALFVGDTAGARATIEGIRARIGWQIDAKGNQAEELVRTRSYHYSNFNIAALTRIAEMGRVVGIDLWHYVAPTGGSLAAAIDRLAPFVDRQKEWPDTQLDPVDAAPLLDTFRKARLALADTPAAARYDDALSRLSTEETRSDRSVLLYVRPAAAK